MASIEPHAVADCLSLGILLGVEQGGLGAYLGLKSGASSLACVPPVSHMCKDMTKPG